MHTDKLDIQQLKRQQNTLSFFTSRRHFSRIGNNKYRTACPFHHDANASFDVYLYDGVWIYKCLGCGVSGDVFRWLMELDKLSFSQALQKVNGCVNVSGTHPKLISTIAPYKIKQYITYSVQ